MNSCALFIMFCLSWTSLDGAKILAFLPFPATSHHQFFRPFVRELAERGHDVTFVTPITMEGPPNYKEILIENRMMDIKEQLDINNLGKKDPVSILATLHETGLNFGKWVCQLPNVKELLHSNDKYDAVITESLFFQKAFGSLAHKFGAADIELCSLGDDSYVNNMVGNPHNPSYILDFNVPYTDNMSFFQRIHNAIVVGATKAAGFYYMSEYQRLSDVCLGYINETDRPPLSELLSSKDLVIVNSHHSLNYPRPVAPHVKEVAGLHIQPPAALPQELKQFMDEAKDGIIYINFGSNLNVSKLIDIKMRRRFVNVFKQINQKILWKWESEEFEDKPDNVKIAKWFPQQDILAHKNCKVFITHGGYLSLTEAVHYGVPIIGVPFYGDQQKNIRHAEKHGYGIHLDFDHLTEHSLSWALEEITESSKYREAAEVRSALFRTRPMSPMAEAVYWTEYVMRFRGARVLRPALAHLPWYTDSFLDVAAICLVLFYFIKYICKNMRRRYKVSNKTPKKYKRS